MAGEPKPRPKGLKRSAASLYRYTLLFIRLIDYLINVSLKAAL